MAVANSNVLCWLLFRVIARASEGVGSGHLIALSFLTIPAVCQADLIYMFDQSNYTVAAGGTVNVNVFLKQTAPTTILTDFGIISASVRVFFNEPVVPSDPAKVLVVGDITPNAAFDDPFLTNVFLTPGVSAGLVGGVDILTPAITGNSILLGTFKFTAGNIAGQVTSLRATDLDPGFDDTVADDSTILDALIGDGFATITVSGAAAVPEPSSCAIAGGLMIAAWCIRRRQLS